MGARGRIDLIDGCSIRLRKLNQHEIYAGLLEGLPTRRMNADIIQRLVQNEGQRLGAAPYVVPPIEKPITYPKKYPFGEPASLPPIACVATFDSLDPARDKQKDYSSLVIIWFQQDYAFPIEPDVFEHIRKIDWTRLASDYEI